MADTVTTPIGWERALMAAERVKERLRRATKALDEAGVPYAVIGGNAVAEWVARVDEGAVRNTRDVNLLVRRTDLMIVRDALGTVGFVPHHTNEERFLDGSPGRTHSGVRLLFAGERVRPQEVYPLPELDESERAAEFQVITLRALIQMKLVAWRDIDRVHLLDLIGVGQLDATWPARFPPPLGERLQELLDNPDG